MLKYRLLGIRHGDPNYVGCVRVLPANLLEELKDADWCSLEISANFSAAERIAGRLSMCRLTSTELTDLPDVRYQKVSAKYENDSTQTKVNVTDLWKFRNSIIGELLY